MKNRLKSKKKTTTDVFDKLHTKKQEKILHACIEEYSESGYDLASTNRIAKKAGIAKGSLFKYFGTKERLFYTVASHVLTEYRLYIRKQFSKMPRDIMERMIALQENIYDFFGKNTVMFRFFKKVLSERGGTIYIKHKGDWHALTKPVFMEILDGADLSRLKVDMETLLNILKWLDYAIDNEIMEETGPETGIKQMKRMYRSKMESAFKVIKKGIYR